MAQPLGKRQTAKGALMAATVLMLSTMAAAADDKPKADPLDPLRSCRLIVANPERLACFDAVSSQILTAAEEGDLSVVDRDEVRKTRRKLFGFSLPDFGIFGGGNKAREKDKADEIEILNTTIAGSRSTRDGLEITTAEGAVWFIDNPPRRLFSPKPGQPVEFRKGTLGSYFVRINGQGGVKGKRIG